MIASIKFDKLVTCPIMGIAVVVWMQHILWTKIVEEWAKLDIQIGT
jgi:hypothetical protein